MRTDGIPKGVSVDGELEVQRLIPGIARSEGGGWNGQRDRLGATRQTGGVQRAGLSQVKVWGGNPTVSSVADRSSKVRAEQ